ncbi:cytochrome c oxidase assembly protein [Porphyrobacter sp. CACIAM 03H1]|jgi:cytochrome c oxidase assembly protein subunit 11|uniref:cytochrome c oxidase assembly protein n=1 Tax=Porphyrobacter sp. CACIAM 03H1 TaxID=2003315 RepID=UPI000B5AB1AE|nr:cytochrome c oxidase assembly protein [Porphyrobacter sp. CACIAM 03H1]ASJ90790.1 cytochrome c oxidase assembly protein [Porphyrobacter sp. CACIAM 03H1]
MASAAPVSIETARSNLRVGLLAFAGALAMLGLGYASVPLYRLFCQVTGFGGTTMQATESDAARAASLATGQKISIRFDATTAMGMPWTFRPAQATDTVTIGERDIATYIARNDSDVAVTGMATFNVEPEQAGKYFNKIQCFCFTEQTLQPGQEVTMPVLYYVDPAALDDPNMKGVEQITLSYTFHRAKDPARPASSGTN